MAAETGQMMNDQESVGAYRFCFGGLPSETAYRKIDMKSYHEQKAEDWYSVDLRGQMHDRYMAGREAVMSNPELKAALATSTGGPGTTDVTMVPIYLDPQIVDIDRHNTPAVELTPRVTNMGIKAVYNRITAKGRAFTKAEGADPLDEEESTYERKSEDIKYLYSVGKVTGQAIAAYPNFMLMGFQPAAGAVSPFMSQNAPNAMQLEVLDKTRSIREKEEDLIFNGNPATTATDFKGISVLLGTVNTIDKNTTDLSLDDLDDSIKLAFDHGGRPNLAFCGSYVFTRIKKLLQAKIGYLQPSMQIAWGFSAIILNTMVGPIPLVPSMYMSNTNGAAAVYFLDMSVVEMRVLQDLTYEQLARTSDFQKFMLKIYECLIIRAPEFCSSITEIKTA